jgi:Zn-dependent oligopeptidase
MILDLEVINALTKLKDLLQEKAKILSYDNYSKITLEQYSKQYDQIARLLSQARTDLEDLLMRDETHSKEEL